MTKERNFFFLPYMKYQEVPWEHVFELAWVMGDSTINGFTASIRIVKTRTKGRNEQGNESQAGGEMIEAHAPEQLSLGKSRPARIPHSLP